MVDHTKSSGSTSNRIDPKTNLPIFPEITPKLDGTSDKTEDGDIVGTTSPKKFLPSINLDVGGAIYLFLQGNTPVEPDRLAIIFVMLIGIIFGFFYFNDVRDGLLYDIANINSLFEKYYFLFPLGDTLYILVLLLITTGKKIK